MKKLIKLLITVIILAAVLISCGKIKDDKKKVVVATVNGQSISLDELTERYNREKKLYGITDEMENNEDMADSIYQFKLDVLDNMIYNKVTLQKAHEKGFLKDDSYRSEADEFYNKMIEELASEMKKDDKGSDDGQKDYNKQAKDYINSYIAENGWDLDEYLNIVADQIFVDKFVESLVEDVKASESELKDYYDEQLEQQTELGLTNQGQVSIVQGDRVRIKYIFIDLPYEVINEYQTKLFGGDTEDAQDYIKEKLAEIKPKADEVYERLENGESFEILLEEINPEFWADDLEDGYIIQHNDPYLFDIEDAAFELKKDQVSDLVETSFGYFIIKAYELIDAKTFTFDEKKQEIEDVVTNNKKDKKLNEIMDTWMEQSEIEIFADRIQSQEK